jgi:hypothetical protein
MIDLHPGRTLDWKWLQGFWEPGRLWVRLFGYGLSIIDRRQHAYVPFSDRVRPERRIGPYRVKVLRPCR